MSRCRSLWLIVLLGLEGVCQGADPWNAAPVVPKHTKLQLLKSPSDHRVVGTESQIEWPATVAKINGQWLQIRDAGRYSVPPVEGWVRKDDVLNLQKLDPTNPPGVYFTQQIAKLGHCGAGAATCGTHRSANSCQPGSADYATSSNNAALARLYWLRGIVAETQNAPVATEAAAADYQTAVCLDSTLADAWLRLGRGLASLEYDAEKKLSLPSVMLSPRTTDDACKGEMTTIATYIDCCFKTAEKYFGTSTSCRTMTVCTVHANATCVDGCAKSTSKKSVATAASRSCPATPALYLAWGNAMLSKFKYQISLKHTAPSTGVSSLDVFKEACAKLCLAERCDPTWYKPPFVRGELLIAYGKWLCAAPNSPNGPRVVHAAAIQAAADAYSQAIRLDPTQDDPFRGRAQALLLFATSNLRDDFSCVCDPPVLCKCAMMNRVFSSRLADLRKEELLDEAFASAQAASVMKNNRNPDDLETLAQAYAAIAVEAGSTEAMPETPGKVSAALALQRRYYGLASKLASKAASYSAAPSDSIRRRFHAYKYYVQSHSAAPVEVAEARRPAVRRKLFTHRGRNRHSLPPSEPPASDYAPAERTGLDFSDLSLSAIQ
jgi:hypothetical protein